MYCSRSGCYFREILLSKARKRPPTTSPNSKYPKPQPCFFAKQSFENSLLFNHTSSVECRHAYLERKHNVVFSVAAGSQGHGGKEREGESPVFQLAYIVNATVFEKEQ